MKTSAITMTFAALVLSTAPAQVPGILNYQGRVTVGGTNLTTNAALFKFALVDGSGSTVYWKNDGALTTGEPSTAVTMAVAQGLYSTLLGDTSLANMAAIPSSVFTNSHVNLRVWFSPGSGNPFVQLTPDQRIGASGYALRAAAVDIPGENNTASGILAVVGGGYDNTTAGDYASVSGGFSNTASATYATIGGGTRNAASGYASTVGGGSQGTALGSYASVGGGRLNTASGLYSAVAGGWSNTASGRASTVGGGSTNTAYGTNALVGGGDQNTATGPYSAVVGGRLNTASGFYSTVGGGSTNTASGFYSTVGGGSTNTAYGTNALVGGGDQNTATGDYSAVVGGSLNTASGFYSTVGGGRMNITGDSRFTNDWDNNSSYQTVSGGFSNVALHRASTVGGGLGNRAGSSATSGGAPYSTIGGGRSNMVEAWFATVPGGTRSHVSHVGSFVWGADSEEDTRSFGDNTFTVRAEGGARFYTANGTGVGAQLGPGQGSWASLSDSNAKTKITAVDARRILAKVASMPVTEWEYKAVPDRRYIGPMAQDFHTAFGLGSDDKTISTLDSDGVMYAAIQGLVAELEERDKVIEELKTKSAEVDALKAELQAVKERLDSLPPAP